MTNNIISSGDSLGGLKCLKFVREVGGALPLLKNQLANLRGYQPSQSMQSHHCQKLTFWKSISGIYTGLDPSVGNAMWHLNCLMKAFVFGGDLRKRSKDFIKITFAWMC
jgi:hypothetical protein